MAVDAIQQTLSEFRSQCERWGREFNGLLDELDALPVPSAVSPTELDRMIETLSGHQQHVAQRQDDIGEQLTAMHRLVEQQVEMLGTMVGDKQPAENSSQLPD